MVYSVQCKAVERPAMSLCHKGNLIYIQSASLAEAVPKPGIHHGSYGPYMYADLQIWSTFGRNMQIDRTLLYLCIQVFSGSFGSVHTVCSLYACTMSPNFHALCIDYNNSYGKVQGRYSS